MRRFLETVTASVLLVLALPVIALSAIAVFLVSPGPVFYRHSRDGFRGRPFDLLKLRTMARDADARLASVLAADDAARREYEQYLRLEHDPRILPVVGRAFRRSSIDELPQLWNIVKGDMSFVGPRPLAHDITSTLDPTFLERRRQVRPGLTGLWQVSGRSDLDRFGLVAIDSEYLDRRSLGLDMKILMRTPAAVLWRSGAY